MRQVKEYRTSAGEQRYRVRYRRGGTETSETFRRRQDAVTFAAILGDGKDGKDIDALRWLQAQEEESGAFTFAEWFELWVGQLSGITPRTRADYRSLHTRYLTSLDRMPLPLITKPHIARLVNSLDDQGLSPKTIRNVVHMLASCLQLAVDEDHMPKNPTKRVRLPQTRRDVHRVRFFTHDEFGALIENMPEHYQPFVAFLFGTGMRWSEATAIEGRHIDFAAGTLRVEQAWKRVPGGWELGPPKSRKSRRTVNPAVPALVAARAMIRKPSDLVFVTPRGNVIRHANFYNRIWQPACIAAGLGKHVDGQWRGPSPHDARHTHASWLISDGQSLEAVQDQLGHESILTTREVYGHLLPSVGVEVGRSASAAMQRALPESVQFRRIASLEPSHGSDK